MIIKPKFFSYFPPLIIAIAIAIIGINTSTTQVPATIVTNLVLSSTAFELASLFDDTDVPGSVGGEGPNVVPVV